MSPRISFIFLNAHRPRERVTLWMKRDKAHRARFQTDSSGVKGNALSDKCKGLSIFGRRTLVVAGFVISVVHSNPEEEAHISNIFAGSDVPCVTERKVFYGRNKNKHDPEFGVFAEKLTMFFSAAQAKLS